MGKRTPVEKAQTCGLTEDAVSILFYITGWFNGKAVTVHDKSVTIAIEHEPTLQQLIGDDWKPHYDEVHEHLTDRGLFKSEGREEDVYIAGRRCRWVPTQECMQIIEHIFSGEDLLYPEWVLDEHTRPPTFRDGNELMEHRKGVLAAKHLFNNLTRVTGIDTYPRVDLPQRPDLRLWGRGGDQLARVEVLTDHRNTDTWVQKFEKWRIKEAGPTIWLFENRKHMIRFWNHLINERIIDLDGGRFGGQPTNWSPRRVNDRLRRSREGVPEYNSHDVVWTIPGVVDGDRVDAFELFKANNITFRS